MSYSTSVSQSSKCVIDGVKQLDSQQLLEVAQEIVECKELWEYVKKGDKLGATLSILGLVIKAGKRLLMYKAKNADGSESTVVVSDENRDNGEWKQVGTKKAAGGVKVQDCLKQLEKSTANQVYGV